MWPEFPYLKKDGTSKVNIAVGVLLFPAEYTMVCGAMIITHTVRTMAVERTYELARLQQRAQNNAFVRGNNTASQQDVNTYASMFPPDLLGHCVTAPNALCMILDVARMRSSRSTPERLDTDRPLPFDANQLHGMIGLLERWHAASSRATASRSTSPRSKNNSQNKNSNNNKSKNSGNTTTSNNNNAHSLPARLSTQSAVRPNATRLQYLQARIQEELVYMKARALALRVSARREMILQGSNEADRVIPEQHFVVHY
eukprot:3495255-Pleurochrysis_carterae.AAC.6